MTGRAATSPAERIEAALATPKRGNDLALVPFLTAGYPSKEGFADLLGRVAAVADAVEVGVPFSDPMADGVTIQRSSRAALEAGVSLRWILETLSGLPEPPAAPLLLMSYLNPLLAYGLDELVAGCGPAHVGGLIVPDLPLEESEPLRTALERAGMALVQLVSPVTPPERAEALCAASRGFVYAVTVTGITGGDAAADEDLRGYLERVRAAARAPLLAGFGIRGPEQVDALRGAVDGVIVGTAFIETLERGGDPAAFLRGLRREG